MPERTRADRIIVASVMLIASLLLFARLDDRYLWQDEAETALLAKSVLIYGVPTAYDGRNLVSQEGQQEFEAPDYRWFWTPWLQHYLAAASFGIFGTSTFSARLPFVLLGLGCLYLCNLLAFEVSRDGRTAAIALVLLATSVPYLLHIRQCRYYAPACFFGCLFVLSYLRVLRRHRGAPLWLAVGATGLFHSHYVVFCGFALGIALHYLIVSRDYSRFWDFAAAAGATILLAVPFIIGFGAQSSGQALPGLDKSLRYLHEAAFHINQYIFPGLLVVPFAGIWLLKRREEPLRDESGTGTASFALVFVMTTTVGVLVAIMPWFFFRYYVPLLPIGAVLQAVILMQVWQWRRGAGIALFFLVALSDLVSRALPIDHTFPKKSVRHFQSGDEDPGRVVGPWFRFIPLAGYLYEVSHEHTGPIEELVRHLKGKTKPTDTILATYGDLPIQFYTDMKVVGGLSREDPSSFGKADWLFVRAHTHHVGDRRLKRFIAKNVDRDAYEVTHLPVLDRPYENRPDPTYHKLRSPSDGLPSVKIWRRTQPNDDAATPLFGEDDTGRAATPPMGPGSPAGA